MRGFYAVLAEVGPVRVYHEGGVVVEARLLFLENRDDEHYPEFAGEGGHQCSRWPPGDLLRQREVLWFLYLAEVGAVEELLETEHLCALPRSLPGEFEVRIDH